MLLMGEWMKFLWLIGSVIGFVVIAVALSGCAGQEPDSGSQLSTVDTIVNGNHVEITSLTVFAFVPEPYNYKEYLFKLLKLG